MKTVLRGFGGVLSFVGITASTYVFGYWAGRYDALYRYGAESTGHDPSIMVGVVLLLFGLFLLFIGILPIKWTDDDSASPRE